MDSFLVLAIAFFHSPAPFFLRSFAVLRGPKKTISRLPPGNQQPEGQHAASHLGVAQHEKPRANVLLTKVPFWYMAVGQNQRNHFGVGTTHFRTYFGGDWDVHWGLTGLWTHGHISLSHQSICLRRWCSTSWRTSPCRQAWRAPAEPPGRDTRLACYVSCVAICLVCFGRSPRKGGEKCLPCWGCFWFCFVNVKQ